jgi:hypothetical protein
MKSQPPRLPDSDLDELPRELAELKSKIDASTANGDPEGLQVGYQRVLDAFRRRRRILSLVQEALSQLRLDIKYLMFDLEVTRRERDELRETTDEPEF